MLDRIRDFLRRLVRSPAFRYLRRDIRAQIGGVVVLVVVLVAIFAGYIARYDPTTIFKNYQLENELLGGATIKVQPSPYGGDFILVTDNLSNDSDNSPGIIVLDNVPPGTYTVTENIAPAFPGGVALGDSTVNVVEVSTSTTTIVTFKDRLLCTILIFKQEDNNFLPLGGATFKVEPNPYGGEFLLVKDNLAPDVDPAPGTIRLDNVPAGTYTVTENVAPVGYYIGDNTAKVFDLNSLSFTKRLVFYDNVSAGTLATENFSPVTYVDGVALGDNAVNVAGVTSNVAVSLAFADNIGQTLGRIEVRNISVENTLIVENLLWPSLRFPFGTDDKGRDLFSRLVYGARTALLIGILLVVVQTMIGLPLGLLAGFRGGNVDNIIMRMVDAVLAMPGLIIALAFVAIFGPGLYKVVLALAITGWAGYARLIRGQTLAIKEETYIEAARAIGEKDRNIIFRYVLPNALSPLIVMVTMTFPAAILLSSSMGFLGLGVQPPTPDWGYDLNAYRNLMHDPMPAPLLSIIPGIIMVITIFGFNFFGDALRDAYDPRLRE